MVAGASQRLLAAVAKRGSSNSAGAKASVLLSLRARREELGITQKDMAAKLGCDRATFCRLENDDRSPDNVEFMFRWASALGGSIGVTFPVTFAFEPYHGGDDAQG